MEHTSRFAYGRVSDNPSDPAKLWDDDGVRLIAGAPAEVDRAVIYADNQRWRTKNPEWRTRSIPPLGLPRLRSEKS